VADNAAWGATSKQCRAQKHVVVLVYYVLAEDESAPQKFLRTEAMARETLSNSPLSIADARPRGSHFCGSSCNGDVGEKTREQDEKARRNRLSSLVGAPFCGNGNWKTANRLVLRTGR